MLTRNQVVVEFESIVRNWGLDNVENMESDAFADSVTLVSAPPPLSLNC